MRIKITLIFLASVFFSCGKSENKQARQYTYQSLDTSIRGFDFVKIPQGEYTFGIYDSLKQISYDYFVMKYEVSCRQYYIFLQQQLRDKSVYIEGGKIYKQISGYSELKDSTYYIKILDDAIFLKGDSLVLNPTFASHPVTQVNWIGCMEFCKYYGLSLPDRYEWEKAARGPTGYNFPWGEDIDASRANYYLSGDPFEPGTTPVGFFDGQPHQGFKTTDSPSPYGCYDMAGNAWEYTRDYWCLRTGGGGGYHYHTAGMVAAPFQNCFGLPYPADIERCDTADGFRAIYIPAK